MLLKLYAIKTEKFLASVFNKPWNTSFWGHFDLAWKPQNKIFLQNKICCCYFMQLSERLHVFIIYKTWKTSMWSYFGPLWPRKSGMRFFSKYLVPSLLSQHFAKNLKISASGFGENSKEPFIRGPKKWLYNKIFHS